MKAGNSALSVEVKLFRSLEAVERDAGGALDRSARGSLFERLDWFRLLETHCPPPGELLVIRARSAEGAAWLFLKQEGRRARTLANWYSFQSGAIIACADRQAGDRLTDALIGGLRKAGVAALEAEPLIAGDPLSLCLPGKLWLHRSAPVTVRWGMNLTGPDFASYWRGRPSRLRNTAERRARSAGLDVRIHSRFDAGAWADYERVYRESWKPEEGSPAFLRALAEQEGAAGTLRLGLAYKDGRPVAAQFWLVEGGIAAIHKLAHVEYAKALSPGTVLGTAMFRHAIDIDRVSGIDFGLGDDRYKSDWVDHGRPMHRMVAYDLLSPIGLWWAARAAGAKLVRRLRND